MTDKQLEWRDSIGTAYVAVAVLAYGLAGVLVFTSGAFGIAVWQLLFTGALCIDIAMRQLNLQALALVRRSQAGWEEANQSNQALLVLTKNWEMLTETQKKEIDRLQAENEALKRDA